MLEIMSTPQVDTGLKLLVAGSVLLLICGIGGLISNLSWHFENRRARMSQRKN